MKKILAVALALVMMLAVCVPAFAFGEDISADGDQSQTQLQTLTTDEEGNPVAGFTVSIPAAVEIPWGGTSTGDFLNWSYTSKLETGKQLSISVDKTSGNLTNGTDNLPYTLTGDAVGTAFLTGEEVTEGTVSKQISIAVTGWGDVPVDAYSDTVTFTVDVVDIV